ncbi:MAG: peptidase M17 [Chlamydiales bacterium 38-26]|nr:hypothetical protein [Chlamydiales bacterium]OJV10786.1 MAG: peptidase M17 [Chlamydiales bacterium 38-26]
MKKDLIFLGALWLILSWLSPIFAVDTTNATLPAVGTKDVIGHVEGVKIDVLVQSPSAQVTPLQIVCLFEYQEGDIYNSPPALPKALNGLVHVDESLGGLITDLRKSKKFEGKSLETLLITPPAGKLKADKLLLIGLGHRDDFKPEMMRMIGVTGMREALRLGVKSYSHASDLKDAGISSPTAEVAYYVVQGALEAYRTQKYLKEMHDSEALTVNNLTLLSGPAYFEDTKGGIRRALENASENSEQKLQMQGK